MLGVPADVGLAKLLGSQLLSTQINAAGEEHVSLIYRHSLPEQDQCHPIAIG